jgi:selenophosphate synthetase-related protein
MNSSVLADVVERFRSFPAIRAKASLSMVAEVLGKTDWTHGPGDDTAVIESGEQQLLFAGEAIWPPLVRSDPFGAGVAAVVANVNDVAAMGGRGLALVDHVVAGREHARRVLEGIRYAAGLYRLPVVGGHLTIWDGEPLVSASILGRAERPLLATNVAPGQDLMLACCLEGSMLGDFPYYSSIKERAAQLADDVEILPQLAREGKIVAAKDVSMPGMLGSLAMLLEPTRSGATFDLDAVPRPTGISIAEWAFVFPTFGFLLCVPPRESEAVRSRFQETGLECERVGSIEDGGLLRVAMAGTEAQLLDLKSQTVTGLTPG